MTLRERIKLLESHVTRTSEAVEAQRMSLATVIKSRKAYKSGFADIHINTFTEAINNNRLRILKREEEIKLLETTNE